MGLDLVELTMAIEDEFEIAIDNKDAGAMYTPGDVADYVISRVRVDPEDLCLSQIGFYKVRSILMDNFQIPRKSICPDTLLQELFVGDIKKQWTRLTEAIDVDTFPKLQRHPLSVFTATMAIPGLVSLVIMLSGQSGAVAFACFVALAIAADMLTRNMGKTIPSKVSTVAALIPFVGCGSTKVWNREQVLERVIEITSEQLGIKIEDIQEDSHFVRDLGAD